MAWRLPATLANSGALPMGHRSGKFRNCDICNNFGNGNLRMSFEAVGNHRKLLLIAMCIRARRGTRTKSEYEGLEDGQHGVSSLATGIFLSKSRQLNAAARSRGANCTDGATTIFGPTAPIEFVRSSREAKCLRQSWLLTWHLARF